MATQSVRLRYRPLRFGWCVRDGNLEDVRRVLRLTHTLWGGRYNPIISVGERTLGAELVKLYRVDALYPAVEDPQLVTFVGGFPYLPWPSFYKQFFIEGMGGRRMATFLDIYHPVRKIFEEYVKDKPEPKVRAMLFQWHATDPLADAFLAYFGAYPAREEIGEDYAEFVEKNLKGTRAELGPADAVPPDAYKAGTPSAISAFDLQRDRSPDWEYKGLYVGDAADFSDIVNFWNLRAADLDLIFFDRRHEGRLRGFTEAYIAMLREQPEDPVALRDGIGIWSKEGTEVDLPQFGPKVIRVEVRETLWNNLKPPLMYIEERSALGSLLDSRGVPSLSFELRPKPFYDEPALHNQDLVVTVRPLLDTPNEETTFRYPYIPELNEYYGGEAYFIRNEARAEMDGLGIITSVTRDDLTIHAVPRRALVSKIFEAFGMKADSSEAGRIAMRLIQQMGGIQGCRVFKIVGVRELIEKYTPLQSFTRGDAIQTIGQNDPVTGIPQFEPYEHLHIEPRKSGKLTPHQVFDFLLNQGVFRVGLTFCCPNCELQFWIQLDDAGTEVACEYCGRRFNVTTQLKDRAWAYRRSGLFGREDHQQGAIPVALTLQQIDTVLHTGGIYITAMTIELITAPISPCETDFVVISQKGYRNAVDLAIGECKAKGGEITEDDVRKLAQVADAFPTERIEAFVVFAKTAPFTAEEIARCRAAQSPRRLRVILLADRELEPYFVYERAEKEFEVRSSAISLEDLARATHDIYFDPKPRRRG